MPEISVDPVSEDPNKQPKLSDLILRITQERGAFTNLTESELEQSEDVETEDNSNDKDEVEEESFSDLRTSLMNNIAQALNESALNLDFVSLLVSSTRPEQGLSTMSPALKEQLQPKSLNAVNTKQSAPTNDATTGYEWKINAYKQASSYLDKGYERLSRESALEAQFWQDLLAACSSGEVINRKLQVKYGYKDSGSTYFHPGVGSITRSSTGHAQFTPTRDQLDVLVQVKVYVETDTEQGYSLVGEACIDTLQSHPETLHLVEKIEKERSKLFQNELMYQLIQEVRQDLSSQHEVSLDENGQITCILLGGKIEIQSGPFKQSLLSPIDLENPAVVLVFALQLLLTMHYHSNFHSQHSEPQILTERKHSTNKIHKNCDYNSEKPPTAAILGPVLGHIQHSILVERTRKLINVILPNCELNLEKHNGGGLADPPKSVLKLHLAEGVVEIEVDSLSNANKPDFQIRSQLKNIKNVDFYSLIELEQWLKWIGA